MPHTERKLKPAAVQVLSRHEFHCFLPSITGKGWRKRTYSLSEGNNDACLAVTLKRHLEEERTNTSLLLNTEDSFGHCFSQWLRQMGLCFPRYRVPICISDFYKLVYMNCASLLQVGDEPTNAAVDKYSQIKRKGKTQQYKGNITLQLVT